jgi:hypothetical protein
MNNIWQYLNRRELGDQLNNLIDNMFLSGELEKKPIPRNDFDYLMMSLKRARQDNKNHFIWFKGTLTSSDIKVLEQLGYSIFNPRRGINYGKTWPGYQISW